MTQPAPCVLDPIRDPRWAKFLDRAPAAIVFHHPAWLRLLAEQYRYPVAAGCLMDPAGAVVAGLPFARVESRLTGRRLVALPFSDVCEPLLGGPHAAELARALDDERRRLGLPLDIHSPAEGFAHAHESARFWHHRLSLAGGPDAVAGRFAKTQVARGIAKARRDGVTVQRVFDAKALDRFFALHADTRRRQGVPTQPRGFMRRLAGLFDQGLGFVLEAWVDGRLAASAVFLSFNGTLIYKYGASDRALLAHRPNNLLFMEAIRIGCDDGMHTLDFGRTDTDNAGLRSFKLGWGADERELVYLRVGDPPPGSGHPRRDAALAAVIRRTPAVVGRAIGATLYRHFG